MSPRVAVMVGALAIGGLVGVGLGGGFLWFVGTAATPAGPPPRADGIVVLTGGTNRVERGIALLVQGRAPRLLVSGVAPGITLTMLARQAGVDPALLAGRVTLGQAAISTHGNAQETAAWAELYGVRSLIVVTAFYHMPRALAELRQALPGTTLHAQPVLPAALAAGNTATPALLLIKEYIKWIALRLGVPRYAPDRRAAAPGAQPSAAQTAGTQLSGAP